MPTVVWIVTLIVFFIITAYKPRWGFAALFTLLPLYVVRFVVLGLPTTLLEAGVFGVLLGSAVFLVHRKFVQRVAGAQAISEKDALTVQAKSNQEVFYKKGQWWLYTFETTHFGGLRFGPVWLLVVFALAGVWAVVSAPDMYDALGIARAYVFEPMLVYLAMVNLVKYGPRAHVVICGLYGAVVVVMIAMVLQVAGLLPIPLDYGLQDPIRFTGPFPFPGAVGLLLAPIAGLSLGLLYGFNKKTITSSEQWLHLTFFALSLTGIVLANARGAILAVGVVMVVLLLLRKKVLVLSLLLVLGLTAVTVHPDFLHQIQAITTGNDNALNVRMVMWKGAWRMIEAHPYRGYGFGGFSHYYALFKEPAHTEILQYPHFIAFNFWIEMGFIGLAGFALLIATAIVSCVSSGFASWRTGGIPEAYFPRLALGLLLAFVVMLVQGLLDVPYFKNDLALLFWMLLALVEIIRYKERPLEVSTYKGELTLETD